MDFCQGWRWWKICVFQQAVGATGLPLDFFKTNLVPIKKSLRKDSCLLACGDEFE